MGTTVEGQCVCGFKTGEMYLGGGMANFDRYCGAPAACTSCGELGVYNTFASRPRCRICRRAVRFLTVREPSSEDRSDVVFEWHAGTEPVVLHRGGHACPRCKRDTLLFLLAGCWD